MRVIDVLCVASAFSVIGATSPVQAVEPNPACLARVTARLLAKPIVSLHREDYVALKAHDICARRAQAAQRRAPHPASNTPPVAQPRATTP
jgi:hypothetical protein